MNERIKQITGQVLDEIVPYTWTTLGYDKIKEIQNRTAELIVRECINICEEQAVLQLDAYRFNLVEHDTSGTATRCSKQIQEHFGVEE
jgi:hypothetical protein